ncbi:MAG: hypothetical protein LQ337_008146 [Flavoplaca oasis]|nr:MAG: hypothetical protein LQ337_008146 [Flavoplaca oasis]
MSGKATAGFADLRAKFENKNETSPPLRGRSPVGPENVKGSGRKIRTSFVSVERCGQMSPSIDQRESMGSNEDQTSVTEGAKDPKAGMHAEDSELPKTNGVAANSEKQEEGQALANEQASPDVEKKLGNGTLEMEEATKTDAVNPDKPNTAGEDDTSSMLPSDPKDEGAVSGGAALAPKGESLGTLLKGSDFEEEGESSKISNQQKSPQKSPKKTAAEANPSTPVKKTKASPKSTPAKAVDTPKVTGSPRLKSTQSRPSTASKSQAPSAAKPVESSPSVVDTIDAPTGGTTPASPIASKPSLKQPREKTASPKQPMPKQQTQPGDVQKPAEKERPKAPMTKASRLSSSTKAIQSTGPSSSKPNGVVSAATSKKSGPRSPMTVKPKPRSPTRPVRLPGAATASTAASSAKTGSTVPPRPESRAGITNPSKASSLNKATGLKGPRPSTANIRSKAPRSSLPAPTTEQKPKPKPRTSIASTKAPGNDFLSRMMRPTTSSASKTHEKVEQKTPPKKRISSRPKRISDESGEAESKGMEAETDSKEQANEKDGQAVNHPESENHQENAVTVPTQEAPTEEIPEPDGNKLTSTNENTVAAS